MPTKSSLKEDHRSEIEERSEQEILEEEIRNQQTLDNFVESDKKLELIKTYLLVDCYELKKITILNFG